MGISGLLPFLKNATRPINVQEFKGCTVAIDSYCWLHKGAFACAEKLARGDPTDQYVYYCMKYVNKLTSLGIRPIMVFDGCHLPSKKEVEEQRRERRRMHRKQAAALLREGRRSEAHEALRKCIDVTSEMAVDLMKSCRAKGVDCIVAPYEADAQLAYLNKIGIADVIITEDSDLVLFGCDKVIFKMDLGGNGMLYEQRNLNKAWGLKADLFTFTKFMYMCILSGCDYLANLPGIGLGKATKVFQRTRQENMKMVLKRLPATLNMNLTVSEEYIEGFFRAVNTFLYQLVFDPTTRRLVPLNTYPSDIDPTQLHYAGPQLDADKAYQLALGNLDTHSDRRLDNFDPDTYQPPNHWAGNNRHLLGNLSIWDKKYKPGSKHSLEAVKKPNDCGAFEISRGQTRGKEVSVAARVPGFGAKRASPRKPLHLTSPRKRSYSTSPRKPPDSEPNSDCLSDEHLLRLYNAPAVVTPSKEPLTKKLKQSHTPVKRGSASPVKQFFTFIDNHTDVDHQENDQKHSLIAKTTPDKPYRSRDSDSVDDATRPNAVDADTTCSKSPARGLINKFRVTSSAEKKRGKFSLNASPDKVRSRFFSAKKPFKKTGFFSKMSLPHTDNSVKLLSAESSDVTDTCGEHSTDDDTGDTQGATSSTSTSIKRPHITDTSCDSATTAASSYTSRDNNTRASSPYGSFGFGHSKLALFKRTTSGGSMSSGVHKLSSVRSAANTNRHANRDCDTENRELSDSRGQGQCDDVDDRKVTLTGSNSQTSISVDVDEASQRSAGLWSIDSSCMMTSSQSRTGDTLNMSSQSVEMNESANLSGVSCCSDSAAEADDVRGRAMFESQDVYTPASTTAPAASVATVKATAQSQDTLMSAAEIASSVALIESKYFKKQPSLPRSKSTPGRLGAKGACRTTGLSKRSRLKPSTSFKENAAARNQKSITNFFTNAIPVKSADKLTADRNSLPLSPKKDNVYNR